MFSETKGDLLVIGYGNTLRRDDGIGPIVAEAIASLNLPGVHAIACHQLTPELAEPISQARGVVFVDADMNAGMVKSNSIDAAKTNQCLGHVADPRSLLTLSLQVFGKSPPAWALGVPVEDLGFGDGLSQRARDGVQSAVAQIKELIRQPA